MHSADAAMIDAALRGDALLLRAMRLWPMGRWRGALAAHRPGASPVDVNAIGKALLRGGEHCGAACAFALALEAAAGAFPAAHFNRGRLAASQRMAADAERHYRRALALDPVHPGASCNLANLRLRIGDREEALALLRRAAAAHPEEATIAANLAAVTDQRLAPHEREAELGRLAFHTERHADAIEHFARAESLGAHRGRMAMARAQAALHTHDLERTLFEAGVASALLPQEPGPAWLRAQSLLAHRRWEDGWRAWRDDWRPRYPVTRACSAPWRGERGPAVRLRVVADQGSGDTVMLARLLPWAVARVGAVALEGAARLRRLLAPVLDGIALLDADTAWEATHHVALGDLPAWHGGAPEDMPRGDFLAGATRGGRRIGLAWQGNPDYGDDARRSLPLEALRPLDRASLLSLQHGAGREALVDWPALEDGAASLDTGADAFVETLESLRGLALLVTSDSAIAHVAGAAGVRAHVLLAHTPDWRWGLDGAACAWHPPLTLWRQESPGAWDPVVARVAAALGTEAER